MSKLAAAPATLPRTQSIAPSADASILVLQRELNWKDGQILALTQQVLDLSDALSSAQEESANLRAQLIQKPQKSEI